MNLPPNNKGVYVLGCANNKYYVGSTDYLVKRIWSHINGYEFRGMKRFTAWTKMNPVQEICYVWHTHFTESKLNKTNKTFNGRKVSLERCFSLMAMENFGIDNVRGYCWTKTKVDLNKYPQIKEMLTTDKFTSMGMLAMDFLEKEPTLAVQEINMSDNSISSYFDECLRLFNAYRNELMTNVKTGMNQ